MATKFHKIQQHKDNTEGSSMMTQEQKNAMQPWEL